LVIDPDAEIVDESFGELEPDDETDSLGGGTDR
jgi:hypothetical protein